MNGMIRQCIMVNNDRFHVPDSHGYKSIGKTGKSLRLYHQLIVFLTAAL